ncbi:MAG: DUF3459 domain-containing protein [Chloroflexi bacterium]|nr:DUF3459 domain-containing protein [Chloroflexota bacterium]
MTSRDEDDRVGLAPDTGFPYHWLYQDPTESPFTGRFAKGEYFEDLDYNNGCTQQFIFDVCKFWLDEYQLDGIRLDYTLGFYLPADPTRGLPKLVTDLKQYLADTNRSDVILTIEHLTDNRYEAIGVANAVGATSCWYDRFLYDPAEYAARGQLDAKLIRVLDTAREFADGKGPTIYVENHDHSTLVNRVGGRQRWWKAQPPLLALFTSPGAILLHNGQEFGDDYYLPATGSERVQPRPLHWSLRDDSVGQHLLRLHQRLIQMRRAHPALRGGSFYPRSYDEQWARFNDQGYGVDTDRDVVIYHRWGDAADGQPERFIVVLNFSAYDQYVDVPFSTNGTWHDLLNDQSHEVRDFRLPNHRIPSSWGKIFYQKG